MLRGLSGRPISTRSSASSRTTASRSSGAPAAQPARRCSIRAASTTSATPWSASRASINAPAARRAAARMCRFRSASIRSGQMLARCATDVGIAVNWAGSGTTTPSVMQIELIDRLKPTIWMGMSSYGLHLANLAEARGLDLAASSVEDHPLLGRAAVGGQARQARAPMGRAGARHVRHDRSRHDGRRGRERRRLPHLDRHVLHRGARSRTPTRRSPKARSAASWSRRCGPTTSRRSCAGARATSVTWREATTATARSRCSRWCKHAHRTTGFFKVRGINLNHAEFEDFMFRNDGDRGLQGGAAQRARSRRAAAVDRAAARRGAGRSRTACASRCATRSG